MAEQAVQFYSENIPFVLKNKTLIRQWIQTVVEQKRKQLGQISIVFCNDEYLHEMNVSYLDHDTLTDIITFDYTENKIISGDLFISRERVIDNAKTLKITQTEELNRVMIHGILHLLGYKDKTAQDQAEMTNQENKALLLLKQIK